MNFNKRLGRVPRLVYTTLAVTILSLGSLLSALSLSFVTGADVAQAVGSQTVVANPRLAYSYKTMNFYVAGENKGFGGIFLQNQDNPAQCNNDGNGQFKIPAPGGGDGAKVFFDKYGNAYMVWRESGTYYGYDVGGQVHFARINADCSGYSGNVNLGALITQKFGAPLASGSPDVTYSYADNRVYISYQGTTSVGNLIVISAKADAAGSWSDASNWDYYNLVASGTDSTEMGTRIFADKSSNIHALFLRNEGASRVKAVDLLGGTGSPWQTYGGAGYNVCQNACDVRFFEFNASIAADGTVYVGYFQAYNGRRGIGVTRYDPGSGWNKLGDNLFNSDNAGYAGTARGIGVAADMSNDRVYLEIGGDTDSSTVIGTFANRGTNLIAVQRAGNYSSGGVVLSAVEQNYRVCQVAYTNDRNNFFTCITGVGKDTYSQPFRQVDTVVDATGYYSPSTTTDTNGSQALVYYALPKAIRLLDTRQVANPATDGYYNRNNNPNNPNGVGNVNTFGAQATLTLQARRFSYNGITIPREAQALLGTITAANPPGSGYGFLTVYPGDKSRPQAASTLLYPAGQYISNSATMTIGSNDTISIFTFTATDVVMDINGYYAPPNTPDPNNLDAQGQPRTDTGLTYYPLSKPTRLLDTRIVGNPATDGLYNRNNNTANTLQGGQGAFFKMGGISYNGQTIPAAAKAVVLNNTLANPASAGFLTIYGGSDPSGNSRPTVASVVYSGTPYQSGQITVSYDANGNLTYYTSAKTDLVSDAIGYFAPPGTGGSNGYYYFALPFPLRLLDTRPVANAATDGLYNNQGAIQGGSGAGTIRQFKFGGVNYNTLTVPGNAVALETNVQVVVPPNTIGFGFMTVYPSDGTAPPSGPQSPPLTFNNLIYGPSGNADTGASGIYLNNAVNMTLGPTDQKVNIYGYTTG